MIVSFRLKKAEKLNLAFYTQTWQATSYFSCAFESKRWKQRKKKKSDLIVAFFHRSNEESFLLLFIFTWFSLIFLLFLFFSWKFWRFFFFQSAFRMRIANLLFVFRPFFFLAFYRSVFPFSRVRACISENLKRFEKESAASVVKFQTCEVHKRAAYKALAGSAFYIRCISCEVVQLENSFVSNASLVPHTSALSDVTIEWEQTNKRREANEKMHVTKEWQRRRMMHPIFSNEHFQCAKKKNRLDEEIKS